MKNSLITSILCAALCVSLNVTAATTWTEVDTIARIYPTNGNNVLVQPDSSSARIDPEGCSNRTWYVLDATTTRFQQHYQAMLTALAAGKRMRFLLSGCIGNYPKVIQLQLYRE